MDKSINIAKKISKDLSKNWLPELEDINIHKVFYPLYSMGQPNEIVNVILCFIIFSYDNDSSWIDLKKDRIDNKKEILRGLNVSYKEDIFQSILNQENDEVLSVIADYLEKITTWKWKTIMSCFDYHSINIQKANEQTKSTDELDAAKINKAKGDLLKESIRQRIVGEELLREIKQEFVKTDRATQTDFDFEFTNERNIDPMSWRSFIEHRNKRKSAATG